MRHVLKSLLPNLAVSAVCCLLGLAGLEYAARLLYPAYNPAGRIRFERNPDQVPLAPAGYVGRQWTNTGEYDVAVRINRYGFRDPGDLRRAGPDDLFVLGDSYAFGHGVPESLRFSDIIAESLAVHVHNIASPTDLAGYGQILSYVTGMGVTVRNLLISVCMENDLGIYTDTLSATTGAGIGTETVSPSWLQNIKELLTAHSCLYSVITARVQRSPGLRLLAARLRLLNDTHGAVTKHENAALMITSSADYLARLTRGRHTWILIIPSRMLWTGGHEATEREVHTAFIKALRDRGLRVIDPAAELEKDGSPLQYHFPLNGHWNVRGHALAARMTAVRIRNDGMGSGRGPAGRDQEDGHGHHVAE